MRSKSLNLTEFWLIYFSVILPYDDSHLHWSKSLNITEFGLIYFSVILPYDGSHLNDVDPLTFSAMSRWHLV
jgi:hypothetical protein